MYQLSYILNHNHNEVFPTLLQAKCVAQPSDSIDLIDIEESHCSCSMSSIDEVIGDIVRHRHYVKEYEIWITDEWGHYSGKPNFVMRDCNEVIHWIIDTLPQFYITDVDCIDSFLEKKSTYLFESLNDLDSCFMIVANKI